MSSASPQRTHSVAVCARRPSKHESQRGEDPALSNGPPQALQSAGKNVVTRSSYAVRASWTGLLSTRETARHSSTLPTFCPARLPGGPGGAPVLLSSELSFQRWLKTHLTRSAWSNFHTDARSIAPPHSHPSTIRHQTRCAHATLQRLHLYRITHTHVLNLDSCSESSPGAPSASSSTSS